MESDNLALSINQSKKSGQTQLIATGRHVDANSSGRQNKIPLMILQQDSNLQITGSIGNSHGSMNLSPENRVKFHSPLNATDRTLEGLPLTTTKNQMVGSPLSSDTRTDLKLEGSGGTNRQSDSDYLNELINVNDDELGETSRRFEVLNAAFDENIGRSSITNQKQSSNNNQENYQSSRLNSYIQQKDQQSGTNSELSLQQPNKKQGRRFSEYMKEMQLQNQGKKAKNTYGELAKFVNDKKEYSRKIQQKNQSQQHTERLDNQRSVYSQSTRRKGKVLEKVASPKTQNIKIGDSNQEQSIGMNQISSSNAQNQSSMTDAQNIKSQEGNQESTLQSPAYSPRSNRGEQVKMKVQHLHLPTQEDRENSEYITVRENQPPHNHSIDKSQIPKAIYVNGELVEQGKYKYFSYEKQMGNGMNRSKLSSRNRSQLNKYNNKMLSDSLSFGVGTQQPSQVKDNSSKHFEDSLQEPNQDISGLTSRRDQDKHMNIQSEKVEKPKQSIKSYSTNYQNQFEISKILEDSHQNAHFYRANYEKQLPRQQQKQRKRELNAQMQTQLRNQRKSIQLQPLTGLQKKDPLQIEYNDEQQPDKINEIRSKMSTAMDQMDYTVKKQNSKNLKSKSSQKIGQEHFISHEKPGLRTQFSNSNTSEEYQRHQGFSESSQAKFSQSVNLAQYMRSTDSQKKQWSPRAIHKQNMKIQQISKDFVKPLQFDDKFFKKREQRYPRTKQHTPLLDRDGSSSHMQSRQVDKNQKRGSVFAQSVGKLTNLQKELQKSFAQNFKMKERQNEEQVLKSPIMSPSARSRCVSPPGMTYEEMLRNGTARGNGRLFSPIQEIQRLKQVQRLKVQDYRDKLDKNIRKSMGQNRFRNSGSEIKGRFTETPIQPTIKSGSTQVASTGRHSLNSVRRNYKLLDSAQKKKLISNLIAERDKLKSNSAFSHFGLDAENSQLLYSQYQETDNNPISIDYQTDQVTNLNEDSKMQSVLESIKNLPNQNHQTRQSMMSHDQKINFLSHGTQRNQINVTGRDTVQNHFPTHRVIADFLSQDSKDHSQLTHFNQLSVSMKEAPLSSNRIEAEQKKEGRILEHIQGFHKVKTMTKNHFIQQKQNQINQIVQENIDQLEELQESHQVDDYLQTGLELTLQNTFGNKRDSQGSIMKQKMSDSPSQIHSQVTFHKTTSAFGNQKGSIHSSQSPHKKSSQLKVLTVKKTVTDSIEQRTGFNSSIGEIYTTNQSDSEYDLEDDEFFKIPKKVKTLYKEMERELRASIAKTHSKHIRKGHKKHKQRLLEFMKVLDREHLERQHRYHLARQSQLDFVHQFAPNFFELNVATKQKIQALRGQIEEELQMNKRVPEWFEILNVELIRKKMLFKTYYNDVGLLQEMAMNDPEFKKQFQKSTYATKRFINGMLKNVIENEDEKGVLEFQNNQKDWDKNAQRKTRYQKKLATNMIKVDKIFKEFIQIENQKGLNKPERSLIESSEGPSATSDEQDQSPAAVQQREAKRKVYKRKYTNDGKLVQVYEEENEFYKARIVEKQMPPQKKVTHRYMRMLDAIFEDVEDDDQACLGHKYEDLIAKEQGLFENPFLQYSQNYMSDKWNMKLNYARRADTLNDLNSLMFKQTLKENFTYNQKFQRHLDNYSEYEKAQKNFFVKCAEALTIPKPDFVQIDKNHLFLQDKKLTDIEAQSLHEFLVKTAESPEMIIKHLTISDCQISDDKLSLILQGIMSQGKQLATFAITNSNIGPQTRDLIIDEDKKFLETINEFHLSNLKPNETNKQFLRSLFTEISYNAKNLMKLKISDVNLADDYVVEQQICQIIPASSKFITYLELSNCSLHPKHMAKIMEEVRFCHWKIRNLNLSYNKLCFEYSKKGTEEYAYSQDFVFHLLEYIDATDKLNLLDISGLGFHKDDILKICNHVAMANMISSLHMNDNGINNMQELGNDFKFEIQDIFGLVSLPNAQIQPLVHNLRTKKPKVLQDIVKKRLGYVENSQIFDQNKYVNFQSYGNHLVRRKQIQQLQQIDQVSKINSKDGVFRDPVANYDKFVVTRQFNFPELVFNQTKDKDNYFECQTTNSTEWEMQKSSDDCFISKQSRYTMIFYERENESNKGYCNRDMVEITDSEQLGLIRKNLNLTPNDLGDINEVPFICGTVNKQGFERKNKMMRADMFTILSLSQSQGFIIKSEANAMNMIKGVWQILEPHLVERGCNMTQEENELQDTRFEGWNKILYDKCSNNDVHDILVLNQPDCLDDRQSPPTNQCYVYASFLPPGEHMFLIYDPKLHRAYCKILVVEQRQKFFFADYPSFIQDKKFQPVSELRVPKLALQKIWKDFLNDSHLHMDLCFYNDRANLIMPPKLKRNDIVLDKQKMDNHYLKFINSSKEEIDQFLDLIRDNYSTLFYCFQDLQSASFKSYPRVTTFHVIHLLIKVTGETLPLIEKKLRALGVENDLTLSRSDFLELLIKLCQLKKTDEEDPADSYLKMFIDAYIQKELVNSKVYNTRKIIRKAKEVNQFFIDNKACMMQVYQRVHQVFDSTVDGKNQKFNAKCVILFVQELQKWYLGLKQSKYRETLLLERMDDDLTMQMFISSKQAIIEDLEAVGYHQMDFIEFLEFMCRVGMHCYKSNYVKTYGLDRVEIKISRAEAVSQLVNVTFEWLVFREKQKRAEAGIKVKKPKKKQVHQREETKFEDIQIVPILQYNSDEGSCYSSEKVMSD